MTDQTSEIAAPAASLSLSGKTEEDLFALALSEVNSDSRRPGLWAKALSDALGDEKKTEALYLRYRKEQLQKEQAMQEQAAEEARRARVVVFNCPGCGTQRRKVTQGIIDDLLSAKSPNWMFQCTDCKQFFDLRDVLPELRTEIVQKQTAAPSSKPKGVQKKTGLATASLVCGICGLAYPTSILFLSSIAGIVCGHMAINRMRTNPKEYDGPKRAKTGLIISYVALGLGLILGFTIGFMRAYIKSAAAGL